MIDEFERLAAEIHQVYCDGYKKRFKEDYWTNGDYSLLDEATKEFDRNIVRWHLEKLRVKND